MWQYIIKVVVTAVLVVAIAEAAKRWTLLGAIIASLPLTSLLAMIWLYIDTGSIEKVSTLSMGIFWVVIPSLVFFVSFPLLAHLEWNFWACLSGSIAATALSYLVYVQLLSRIGVL